MNQNFNQLQIRFPGLGCWLFILIGVWVLSAIGLSGVIKSIFGLVLFLLLAPVLAFFALRFWIKRNLVTGNCPVCEQPLTSLKSIKIPCPSCGTELSTTQEGFERLATDGVIDIQAVDIQAGATEAGDVEVIDVEVQRLPESDR